MRKGNTANARECALSVLVACRRNGAWADAALKAQLGKCALSAQDAALCSRIVYGVMQNELLLNWYLSAYCTQKLDHLQPPLSDILRIGAYQILFLDKVPDHAAVSESVELCRTNGRSAASGLVNAVLRKVAQNKSNLPPLPEGNIARLSVAYSHPQWLVKKLVSLLGVEEAEAFLRIDNEASPISVQVNPLKTNEKALVDELRGEGVCVTPHPWVPGCLELSGTGDLTTLSAFYNGRFTVQDAAAHLIVCAADFARGQRVLDVCAAPGGKSAYLCEQMQLTGRVYAWELHEKRAQLLEGVRRRLGLDNLRISVRDALDFRPDLEGALDGVLLDAPCAGLGVLSQKPDIKLRLKEEDIPAIVDTQGRLIDTVCRYVRPGGALVYSTCSLLPEENADRVRTFLQAHPNFTLEPLPTSFPEELRARQTPCGLQLLGCRDGVEGFFIARMRRVR